MKTLMIVGASEYMTSFVEKACRQSKVIIISPEIPDVIRKLAYKTYRIDVKDKEAILQVAKDNNIDGITTDQAERPVGTVAYVAEKLGLVGNGINVADVFTNKYNMRSKLKQLGFDCLLPYKVVDNLQDCFMAFESIDSACVIKPVDSRGSRGVYLIHNKNELENYFYLSKNESLSSKIIIEKYVKGKEIVVEGIALNGRCESIAVGESIPFGIEGLFSPKERVFPSSLTDDLSEKVANLNTRILEAFGLKNGVSQSEYIVNNEGVFFIESCARGGGMFISSDIAPCVSGIDLADFAIKTTLGNQKELLKRKDTNRVSGYIAFYLPEGTVKSVSGIDQVKSLDYVLNYKLNPIGIGMTTLEIKDKTARYCIALYGNSKDEYEQRKKEIRGLLRIVVESKSGELLGPIWS